MGGYDGAFIKNRFILDNALIIRPHLDVAIQPISTSNPAQHDTVTNPRTHLGESQRRGHALRPSPSTALNASSSPSRAPSDHLHPFRVGLRDTARALHSFRRGGASRTPPPTSTETGLTHSPPAGTAEPSSVHVALAIAMPVARPRESGVPLYALGIADVVWGGDSIAEKDTLTPVAACTSHVG